MGRTLVDRLAERPDPRTRLVWIFVGAVLLPSLALSLLSFYAVPKQASATNLELHLRAEQTLSYVEEDLARVARDHVQQAARAVGSEALLDGHPERIRQVLERAGFPGGMFASLRLEGSSSVKGPAPGVAEDDPGRGSLRDAVWGVPDEAGDESLAVGALDGLVDGVLRYRFTRSYVNQHLLAEYFQRRFHNPFGEMVIRVREGRDGAVVYETAPTPEQRNFEAFRTLGGAFRHLSLALRYRDRSIEDEVRRWAMAKTALIACIDLMLAAGLVLVYSNVRRELRLSKLKSDFVANVSHELKTPLALIRLFSETLEMGRVPSEDKKLQYYRVIHKESRRLTQLINNILDFSRIEAGRREYRFKPADVARIVDDVLDAYRFQIEQQGFALAVEMAEDLPWLEVDEEALGQALLNILNNAVKYSREHKTIAVNVLRDERSVRIAVRDHGIGIRADEQDKVFEKFYRAGDTLVHETRGSGLGLALVRHIMEAHAGRVELASTPGQGSTFTLVLPLQRPTAAGSPAVVAGVEG